jgi:hypothetical protein
MIGDMAMTEEIIYNVIHEGNEVKLYRDDDGIKLRYGDKIYGPYPTFWHFYSFFSDAKENPELKRILWRIQHSSKINFYELVITDRIDLELVKKILGLTIKHDDTNKLITFLCMLAAYTEDSQFNISFRAESSTGKSYIPLEIAQLFPKEDIIEIAYASPSSFFHEYGERDEESKEFVIDLQRKILIFIDMPHDQLLVRLRPLLSHDRKELHYRITDKTAKGKLRTKRVKILGFPSVIFCTGKLAVEDQEATRLLLLSPETSQEKLREAIYLRAKREANKKAFLEWLESNPMRQLLKERIRWIKSENIRHIIVPNEEEIIDYFIEKGKLKPRYTRDISRLIYLVKALALLNLWHRERDGDTIYANEEDLLNAFDLYEGISESQELGIPPYVYKIYKEIIVPLYKKTDSGISKQDLAKKFYELYGRALEDWRIRREIIPALETAGLITLEPDPLDKRRKLIVPILEGVYTPMLIPTVTKQNDTPDIINKIFELRDQGLSVRKIAKELGLSHMKIWRVLKDRELYQMYRNNGNQEGVGTPLGHDGGDVG